MRMAETKQKRVIVDPAVKEARDAFQRMMERFRSMSREEHIQFGIEHCYLNADGTPKVPDGAPYVTGA